MYGTMKKESELSDLSGSSILLHKEERKGEKGRKEKTKGLRERKEERRERTERDEGGENKLIN